MIEKLNVNVDALSALCTESRTRESSFFRVDDLYEEYIHAATNREKEEELKFSQSISIQVLFAEHSAIEITNKTAHIPSRAPREVLISCIYIHV